MLIEHILHPNRPDTGEPFYMTFATPPSSLSLSSENPAQLLSPIEEMQLYCGFANQEPPEASHMELEQENPSQKHRRDETTDDRPTKHPKPESGAGKGKGNRKGRSPHGSGHRPPAHRQQAQPTSNQELLLLCQVVSALCKLCLRHEDALNLHSLDTRLVLFWSNHEQGLPSQLWKGPSNGRPTRRRARSIFMSLRVTMAMYILGQVKQRAEALHLRAQTEDLQEPESTWLTKNQWSYLLWDAQAKKHMFNADAEPMEHAQVIKNIDRLHRLLPQDNQCASSLPLPPASHRGLGCSGDRLHHGRGIEGRGCTGGLHTPSHHVPAIGGADGVDEPPPGQASTVNFGQPHPSTARQIVGQMRLANSSKCVT